MPAMAQRFVQSYLPYDTVPRLTRFMRHFTPRICILMETEVWPNLISVCKARGVTVALVNARLSERSLARARKLGPLMREAAAKLTLVAAQTEQDAARVRQLGADAGRGHGQHQVRCHGAAGSAGQGRLPARPDRCGPGGRRAPSRAAVRQHPRGRRRR